MERENLENERKVFEQEWYHGMLPRKEINELLKNHGDWLVRMTEKGQDTRFVISVRWKKDFKHIMLKKEKRGYVMPGNKIFQDVYSLIESYRKKSLPLNDAGVNLQGRAVPRKKWMIPSRDVVLENKIGEGAFGEVYVGNVKFSNKQIPAAIKTCKQAMTTDERDEFLQEAKLMLNYRHINVVSFFGVAADKPPLMLLMECCSNGSLDKYLQRNPTPINDKVRFCVEAARGMEYLAVKKNCVHRDLAARNCLIGAQMEIKIADFGLSRTGAYKLVDMKNTRLPIKWAAPESLEDGNFSTASDVWSFGILMWEIFADAQIPWPDKSNKEAFVAMRRGEKMEMPVGVAVPPEMKDLMHACWMLQPDQRPNMTLIRETMERSFGFKSDPLK